MLLQRKAGNQFSAGEAGPQYIINNVDITGKIHCLLCISGPICFLVAHFSFSCRQVAKRRCLAMFFFFFFFYL